MTSRRSPSDFKQPAVFLVNGFGDQLIALPAMRALGAIFPGGMQLLLGEGMLSFFFRGLPVGEPVRAWWADEEKYRIDVERIMRSTRPCDLFLSLSSWATPSVKELARAMGATWSIGQSKAFDDYLPVDESVHQFDQLFAIPQHFRGDLRIEDFSHAPRFSPAAEEAAERYVRKRVAPGSRILFLHPETSIEKMWQPESFSWVVERFLERRPEFKVLVATRRHYPLDFGRHGDRILWIEEHLELAMAILKHADVFLGIDSCFLHAADLFRIPAIGLFGPTSPHEWGFRFSPHARVIWARGELERIGREEVLDALLKTAEACVHDARSARPEATTTSLPVVLPAQSLSAG